MAEENAGDPMSSSNGGHLRLHSPTSGSRTETVTIDETQVAQTVRVLIIPYKLTQCFESIENFALIQLWF